MSVKRILRRVGIVLMLMFVINLSEAQRVRTVVLDAGHGGHDTGALGKNSREKDITLDIVLKLRDYILLNIKDVKVVLTRDSDVFVELYRRAKIANTSNADLFISIHCNATRSAEPFGTETFVMGLHKSEANLAVAKAENSAILLEDNYVVEYDGFNPNSPEGNIFFAMMQNTFLDNSLAFAGKVQKQFKGQLNRLDRGVKQAGFLVLYKTAMPGVLIETGFLSNSADEKYLLSEKGRNQIAAAIGKALLEYKAAVEKLPAEAVAANPETLIPDSDTSFTGKEIQPATVTVNTAQVSKPKPEAKKNQPAKPEMKPESIQKPAAGIDSTMPAPGKPGQPASVTASRAVTSQGSAKQDELVYKIQFYLSPKLKSTDAPEFKNVDHVEYYLHDGNYKYTSGRFSTLDKANEYRQVMVNKGFKDAFVVPFLGNKRITLSEARKITGN